MMNLLWNPFDALAPLNADGSLNRPSKPCPWCGTICYRHRWERTFFHIRGGDLKTTRPHPGKFEALSLAHCFVEKLITTEHERHEILPGLQCAFSFDHTDQQDQVTAIFDGDKLVATQSLGAPGSKHSTFQLYCLPEYRGRGIGGAIHAIEYGLSQASCHSIYRHRGYAIHAIAVPSTVKGYRWAVDQAVERGLPVPQVVLDTKDAQTEAALEAATKAGFHSFWERRARMLKLEGEDLAIYLKYWRELAPAIFAARDRGDGEVEAKALRECPIAPMDAQAGPPPPQAVAP